jgi:hypothetical protein
MNSGGFDFSSESLTERLLTLGFRFDGNYAISPSGVRSYVASTFDLQDLIDIKEQPNSIIGQSETPSDSKQKSEQKMRSDREDHEFLKTQWESLSDAYLNSDIPVQPWHKSFKGKTDDEWQAFWKLLKNELYWNLYKGIGPQKIQPEEYAVIQEVLARTARNPECISRQQWHLAKRVAYGIKTRVSNGEIGLLAEPPAPKPLKPPKPNIPRPYQAYAGWALGNHNKR